MEVKVDAELFSSRIKRLVTNFVSNKELWSNSDAICVPMGSSTEEELNYSKSSALHLYLLGYEFADSLFVLTKSVCCFMATEKKCGLIQEALKVHPVEGLKFEFFKKTKNEIDNKSCFESMLSVIRKAGSKLGTLLKADFQGTFIPQWQEALSRSNLSTVEIASNLGAFFASKEETELVSICAIIFSVVVYFLSLSFNNYEFINMVIYSLYVKKPLY